MYRQADREAAIRWHDVSINEGDLRSDGVSQAVALDRLHARLSSGQLVTGVTAFLEIWSALPRFRPLVPLARRRPIRWLLEWGYDWYAPRRNRLVDTVGFSRSTTRQPDHTP